jgi:hypothetical protein
MMISPTPVSTILQLRQIEDVIARQASKYKPVKYHHKKECLARLDADDLKVVTSGTFVVDTKPCLEQKPYIAISHVWSNKQDEDDWTQPQLETVNKHPFRVRVNVSGTDHWVNDIETSSWSWNVEKLFLMNDILAELGSESVWWDWKDVDQVDATKKTAQVLHMPEIYRDADLVVIIHTCSILRRHCLGFKKIRLWIRLFKN